MGEILDEKDLYLTVHVGEANCGNDGHSYNLSTLVNCCPVITSKKTEKRFALSWTDIIKLAIEAGIDKKD